MSIYARQRRFFAEAYARGDHPWPATEPTLFIARRLRRLASGLKGRWALDLGCGEGRHLFLAARLGLKGIGVDLEPLALKRAKDFADGKQGFFAFLQADAFALPFEPGAFHLLIDSGCFHHVRKGDWPRYRSEVGRLLAPGGYFFLTCFSTRFRHYPGERRARNWVVHRNHYDHFFRKRDFPQIFGDGFALLAHEEDREGFHHVLMRRAS